jgi:hypothetical protein
VAFRRGGKISFTTWNLEQNVTIMELKDLKQNDLVEFNFGSNCLVVKGIFDGTDNDNIVFKITSLGYERQVFDKKLVRNINILQRPAIEEDYDYIKECLREKEIEYIDKKIEILERKKEDIKRNFLPTLNDVLNYAEEEYY